MLDCYTKKYNDTIKCMQQVLPKLIWEKRVAVLFGYNAGTWDAPNSPQNYLFLRRPPQPSYTSTDPTHPDHISRFATIHFPDTQTDRHNILVG